MTKKRIIVMRHGSIFKNGDDYENMSYEEFMAFLCKSKNPPLEKLQSKRNKPVKTVELEELRFAGIDASLMEIDAILPSPTRRAAETANLIKYFLKQNPKIDKNAKYLLAEVNFEKGILSKEEYAENGGWNGCRPIVLERWFKGEKSEKFETSFSRMKELDGYLRKSKFSNILLITHGIFLRMIHMYYHDQLKVDKDGNLIRDDETLKNLLATPRLEYGGFFEFELYGKVTIIENHSTKSDEKIIKANAVKTNESNVIKISYNKNTPLSRLFRFFS